ncbi:MAG: patatin-like phospholipase family protein [Hyphomicrobiales bacterium]|nr:patatin-like phospholipase family protein [Hyphomicrobiales bacterium]
MRNARKLTLALGGGNALGAFEAGALGELICAGRELETVAGTSIGAINAALFLGARDGDPERALKRFWEELAQDVFAFSRDEQITLATASALLFGRPTVSRSHIGSLLGRVESLGAMQDQGPLTSTLERLVDFDKLAQSKTRFIVCAVALDPDEPVTFDSASTPISVFHLLASAAIPVLFPPVFIGERAHVDGGVALNLPIEPVLASTRAPFDCIALDPFALGGKAPTSLGAAGERIQNLIFGMQSERILGDMKLHRDCRVLHVTYRPPQPESAAKAFDYSRESIRMRWKAGEDAMRHALRRCEEKPKENLLRLEQA